MTETSNTSLSDDNVSSLLADCFSDTYAQARQRFLAAAGDLNHSIQSHVHPDRRGAQGEALTIDVLRLGRRDARRLLIISSGVHGVEGFCGSGCQVALLHDAELRQRIDASEVAVLLIHAVNPFGFSWMRRVNEDNIDLNRNFIDFEAAPPNPAYGPLDALLIPASWPPDTQNTHAIESFISEFGLRAFQEAVGDGQSSHPKGMFYRGKQPAWSNRQLRAIIRAHGNMCTDIAWIDLHTGLGRYGHGEKIFSGQNDAMALARARACWGADVVSPFAGESVANTVIGHVASCLADECPQARNRLLALEFGTQPLMQVLTALRAHHWLANQQQVSEELRRQINQSMREAFYGNTGEWRAMVSSQTRVAVIQALNALSSDPST